MSSGSLDNQQNLNGNHLTALFKNADFLSFFEKLQEGIINKMDLTINSRITHELNNHLGIKRELTSDQIEQYQKKLGETYSKILKK